MLWVKFTPFELKVSVQALQGKAALQLCEVLVQPTHRAVTALMSLTLSSTPNRLRSSAILAQLPEIRSEIHPENRNRTSRAEDKINYFTSTEIWVDFTLWVLHKVLDNTNSSSTGKLTATSCQCRHNFFCSMPQHTCEPWQTMSLTLGLKNNGATKRYLNTHKKANYFKYYTVLNSSFNKTMFC